MRREEIITEAREWLGTRWQHQASAKGIGCDCIGFVAGVARACGVEEAEPFYADGEIKGYGPRPNPQMLMSACSRYLDPISYKEAKPADLLVMRFHGEPQHFAFLSDRNPDYMLHAYAQARKVVENRIDALWRSRIVAAYRLRGVA